MSAETLSDEQWSPDADQMKQAAEWLESKYAFQALGPTAIRTALAAFRELAQRRAQDAQPASPVECRDCDAGRPLEFGFLHVHSASAVECPRAMAQPASARPDVCHECKAVQQPQRCWRCAATLARVPAPAVSVEDTFWAGYRTWPAVEGNDDRAKRVLAEWLKPSPAALQRAREAKP
jgi:hypothetical protein